LIPDELTRQYIGKSWFVQCSLMLDLYGTKATLPRADDLGPVRADAKLMRPLR
jgi:hypothetical protein